MSDFIKKNYTMIHIASECLCLLFVLIYVVKSNNTIHKRMDYLESKLNLYISSNNQSSQSNSQSQSQQQHMMAYYEIPVRKPEVDNTEVNIELESDNEIESDLDNEIVEELLTLPSLREGELRPQNQLKEED